MGTALTIRNLDEEVKQRLRLRAASNRRSMEAEARAILAQATAGPEASPGPLTSEEMRERLATVRGIWRDRGTTDELMALTRGDD